jgi:hypothetical protein
MQVIGPDGDPWNQAEVSGLSGTVTARLDRLRAKGVSPMHRILRVLLIAVFAAFAVAAMGAPAAFADKCGNPAICQYEEQIPTASGSKVAGSGGATKVANLPKSIERSIARQTGSATETQTLVAIATTSGAAAPRAVKVKTAKQRQKQQHVQKAIKRAEVNSAKPIRAGFDAVSGGGNGHLTGLIVALAVMTAVAAAAAIVRRRSASTRRR